MPPRVPNDTLPMLLTDVSRLLRSAFDRHLNACGLGVTPGEARALLQVAATEGIRQTDIAVRMGIEPMTLSSTLDRLEALGFVTRLPDPADRRAKNVVVTEAAYPLIDAIRKEVRTVMEPVTAGLDAPSLEILRQMLLGLRDNLHGLDRTSAAERAGGNP